MVNLIWDMLNLCCPWENPFWGARSNPEVSGKDGLGEDQKEESTSPIWTACYPPRALSPSQSPVPPGNKSTIKKGGQCNLGSVPIRPQTTPSSSSTISSTTVNGPPPSLLYPKTPKRTKLSYKRHLRLNWGKLSMDNGWHWTATHFVWSDNNMEGKEQKGFILKWCTWQFRGEVNLQHTFKCIWKIHVNVNNCHSPTVLCISLSIFLNAW